MIGGGIKQSNLTTARDNVGGDVINDNSTNNNYYGVDTSNESPIISWMRLLAEEIKNNQQALEFIDTLQMYHEKYSHDGIDGLENKLEHSNRKYEIKLAIRKKELFDRLLAKYSMFDSAQQIFAYILSKLECDFSTYVLPSLENKTIGEIDQLFTQYLIMPCTKEIKSGVFCLNPAIASGMVYWLAEQCYIRWHA